MRVWIALLPDQVLVRLEAWVVGILHFSVLEYRLAQCLDLQSIDFNFLIGVRLPDRDLLAANVEPTGSVVKGRGRKLLSADAFADIFDHLNLFESGVPQANRSVLSYGNYLLLLVEYVELEYLAGMGINSVHDALSIWINQNQLTFGTSSGHEPEFHGYIKYCDVCVLVLLAT